MGVCHHAQLPSLPTVFQGYVKQEHGGKTIPVFIHLVPRPSDLVTFLARSSWFFPCKNRKVCVCMYAVTHLIFVFIA